MRIAAKRLRYVLEIFAPCLDEEAKTARDAAKRLQSVLGDLHDCDLMLTKVEHIGSVAAVLRGRRERLFHEFVELWQAEASKGTWGCARSLACSPERSRSFTTFPCSCRTLEVTETTRAGRRR